MDVDGAQGVLTGLAHPCVTGEERLAWDILALGGELRGVGLRVGRAAKLVAAGRTARSDARTDIKAAHGAFVGRLVSSPVGADDHAMGALLEAGAHFAT